MMRHGKNHKSGPMKKRKEDSQFARDKKEQYLGKPRRREEIFFTKWNRAYCGVNTRKSVVFGGS